MMRQAFSASAQEHIKELVRHLNERALETDSLLVLVHDLHTCLSRHIQEEEQEIFPQAEAHLGPALQQLARELDPHATQEQFQPVRAEQQEEFASHDNPLPNEHIDAMAREEDLPLPILPVEAEQSTPAEPEPPFPAETVRTGKRAVG